MRSAFAATLVLAAALFAASMLGVAVAEAPTVAPTRTVSVQGVAMLPVAQNANASTATGVYREAMAAAVSDAQGKASFLASKAGATVTQVQSIAEEGGYIECRAPGEPSYAEYEGEQPDFGSAPRLLNGVAAPAASSPAQPTVGTVRPATPKKKKRKLPTAKRAVAASCTLSAQVSLVYAIQ